MPQKEEPFDRQERLPPQDSRDRQRRQQGWECLTSDTEGEIIIGVERIAALPAREA
jgi:hypothetical protein